MNPAPLAAANQPPSANPKAQQSFLIEFENATVHNHTEYSVGLEERTIQPSESGSTNSSLLSATQNEGEVVSVDISSSLSKGYLKHSGNPLLARTLTITIGDKVVKVNDYFTLVSEMNDETQVLFGKVNASIPKNSSRAIKSNAKFSLRKRVKPVVMAKEKICSQNPFKVLRSPLGRTNS